MFRGLLLRLPSFGEDRGAFVNHRFNGFAKTAKEQKCDKVSIRHITLMTAW